MPSARRVTLLRSANTGSTSLLRLAQRETAARAWRDAP